MTSKSKPRAGSPSALSPRRRACGDPVGSAPPKRDAEVTGQVVLEKAGQTAGRGRLRQRGRVARVGRLGQHDDPPQVDRLVLGATYAMLDVEQRLMRIGEQHLAVRA